MPQTGDMANKRIISKLLEVDPAFREVVTALYGDAVDPRELWDLNKGMPDQSSAHVLGNGGGPKPTKKKALAAGLVFGTAAESTATAQAAKNAFPTAAETLSRSLKPLTTKIPKVKLHGGAKANFALQATNAGIGLAAAHELFKKPGQNAQKSVVKKGVFKDIKSAGEAGRLYQANTRAKQINRGRKGLLVATTAGGAVGGYKASEKGVLKPRKAATVPPQGVTKSAGIDMVWTGEIMKFDAEKRQVFGWCSLTRVNGEDVVDLQGDYIPLEEIEKSAYKYVIESRKGGDMHRRENSFSKSLPLHTSDMIESFVVTPEKLSKMGLQEDALPHGWWVGFKVNDDEQWQLVKDKKRTGFSIHGSGTRVEKSI